MLIQILELLWGLAHLPQLSREMVAVGAWPHPLSPFSRCGGVVVTLALSGRRGGVPEPLGLVRPPWGLG